MSKRFVDTELWQKEWFQELSLKEKILIKYIFENCDNAGVWNGNFRMASFIIGEQVTLKDLENINSKKVQFEILKNGSIFILDFIKFQYGTLSENCKPHKPVIEKLKNYGLYERVLKGYPKGIETLEEKEKEKDINDPYINPYIDEFKQSYTKVFNSKPYLTNDECHKICELAADIDDFKGTIPVVLAKLKEIDFGFDNWKPTANWLLKDNNYTTVLNGAYDKVHKKTVWEELRERHNGTA